MQRYQADVRDGTFYIETCEDWLEIGSMDDICELVGGETYSIEYDKRQRMMDWVETDYDNVYRFDVRETLTKLSYDEEFVENIGSVAINETDEERYPLRTSVFADLMVRIWDSKGDLDRQ